MESNQLSALLEDEWLKQENCCYCIELAVLAPDPNEALISEKRLHASEI